MKLFRFALGLVGVTLLFVGCGGGGNTGIADGEEGESGYMDLDPTQVTVAKSIPYNCKLLGEVQGSFGSLSPDAIREEALTDARTKAAQVVGSENRTTIVITREVATCKGKGGKDYTCSPASAKVVPPGAVLTHTFEAQVFDCGLPE